jgi:hypothetical protein
MAGPVTTPNRGFILPAIGTRPWKAIEDFNWRKADADLGGLINGTIPAGVAASVVPTAITPYVLSVTGTLSGTIFPASGVLDVLVSHANAVVFDVPASPIFQVPAGVSCIMLGNLTDTSNASYGGTFAVRVQNNNSANVDGATISWRRKGLRLQ